MALLSFFLAAIMMFPIISADSVHAGPPVWGGGFGARLGDINGNGRLDAADVTLVRRFLESGDALSDAQKIAADVNMDKKITQSDVVLIRYASGQLITLPAAFGDMNGNLILQSNDTTLVRRIISGLLIPSKAQKALADVDLNGVIDEGDAQYIREAIGQLRELPVQ